MHILRVTPRPGMFPDVVFQIVRHMRKLPLVLPALLFALSSGCTTIRHQTTLAAEVLFPFPPTQIPTITHIPATAMWILRSFPALLTILGFLTLRPVAASAQGFGDADNLYIPPKLTVESNRGDEAPKIEIEETRRTDWTSLIPAVFFENPGDWTIPERYHLFSSPVQTRDYADTNGIENDLPTIEKYREMLNIIGYRMLQHPDATLSLRGCYSFEGGESEGVARERALVVREYLASIWDIDTVRLHLLEPARRGDTFSSNPVQEEARRVEFESDDPVLLAPVSFHRLGITGIPTLMTILVLPNMEPSLIDSIVIIMLDEEGEVQDRKAMPGNPDSTQYLYKALWVQEKSRGEDGMTMVARVLGSDGRYRPSNKVFLPVQVSRQIGDEPDVRNASFTIPFLSYGRPDFGEIERDAVRNAVDWFHARIAESDRKGYFMFVQGNVDLSEHPGYEPIEVNVQVASMFAERENAESRGRNSWAGRLMVMTPIKPADGQGGRSYSVAESREEHEEGLQKVRERREAAKRQRSERPDLTLADSLADRRAEGMIQWMIDSLDLSMINDELPDGAGRVKSPNVLNLQTDDEFETIVARFTTSMRTGLVQTGNQGTSIGDTPEERWYQRGVRIDFWTKSFFESMMQMTAPGR